MAVMCLAEKTLVLDELLSGMSYRSVGHDFSAHEATIHINKASLSRNTHKTRLYADQLTEIL